MPLLQIVPRLLSLFLLWTLGAGLGVEFRQADGSEAPPSGTEFHHEVEQQTFSLVNEYRVTEGMPALRWDDRIADEARGHSRDMATREVDFGHEGFSGRVSRLRAVMSGFQGAGENVLWTDNLTQVARQAVALWLRSPGHLKNIRGDYNCTGVGVWQNKSGAIYFTQMFLKLQSDPKEAENDPPAKPITPLDFLAPPTTRGSP